MKRFFSGLLFPVLVAAALAASVAGCAGAASPTTGDADRAGGPAAPGAPAEGAKGDDTVPETRDENGPFPGVKVKTPDGEERELAALMEPGKPTLLVFWASWCSICKGETPDVIRLHRDLSDRGLKVIGLNIGEKPAKARSTAERWGIPYPVAIVSARQTSEAFSFTGTPWHILVDAEGNTVSAGRELPSREAITALLEKP